jgi:hypothetical protein
MEGARHRLALPHQGSGSVHALQAELPEHPGGDPLVPESILEELAWPAGGMHKVPAAVLDLGVPPVLDAVVAPVMKCLFRGHIVPVLYAVCMYIYILIGYWGFALSSTIPG